MGMPYGVLQPISMSLDQNSPLGIDKERFGRVLVTGGHGFIGSHVALRLLQGGIHVVIVDIAAPPPMLRSQAYDFIQGDLRDHVVCERAVRGVTSIFHFAANMGGMGTIHQENDLLIYDENHTMTLRLISASIRADVKHFFYASSACVYPDALQQDPLKDVSLREDDTWKDLNGPPKPQGLYGLEKFNTELLLLQLPESSNLDVRIARFHNVYGPGGSWNNGREKAPAALLRKACALKYSQHNPMKFELWGDGQQRRSFLWVDDAVDAVLRLFLSKTVTGPVNIGSAECVTIRDLARIALEVSGIDASNVTFDFLGDKPVGVASRNSDNTLVASTLLWEPRTSLEEGMKQTYEWIDGEIRGMLASSEESKHHQIIEDLKNSQLLRLGADSIPFAALLPVTSRGCGDPGACLENLIKFATSFVKTTWRDTQPIGGTRFHTKVYLAIDHDDHYLLSSTDGHENRAEAVLRRAGLTDIKTIICNYPRGHVCSIWREIAKKAWEDGCEYFVLLGDDIILRDEGWMREIHAEFVRLSADRQVPYGFGCVAFTDLSFPGMPTFPVIHRTHMDIFHGVVVPEAFINQDGDPFLFQLYRRWGCSSMLPCALTNGVGGTNDARYVKTHAVDWTFETLDEAVEKCAQWLASKQAKSEKLLTIDIVIPCYRVDLPILHGLLSLEPSDTCSVMFIVIIDNPHSIDAFELERQYGSRPDIRIRRNKSNAGASASRNRGMDESSAEWIIFLDDDVVPRPNLLIEAEKAIRAHPTAAGFVGNSQFPVSTTIFTTAVRIAGVAFFWDISTQIADDVPWGVTANLIARRKERDGIKYNLIYPKTGGGEDIEFCRQKRAYSLARGGKGFMGAPEVIITHPWWNDGARSYRRFYMWSYGDGALVKRFPDLSYWDYSLNSAEMLFLSALSFGILPLFIPFRTSLLISSKLTASVVLANVVHDCYRHLWRDADRHNDMKTTLAGPRFVVAVLESALIRMASEMGRLHGMIARGDVTVIGKRFDWFAGRWGKGPRNEERKNNLQRAALVFGLFSWFLIA